MKNILFLVGLIMIATACTSTGSSFLGSSEESSESNVSMVLLKKHKSGARDFGVCTTNYDAAAQTLNFDLDGKNYSFPLSKIQDQYIDRVKKNKVTLLKAMGDFFPAVVEKSDIIYEDPPILYKDDRQFKLKCILKDSNVSHEINYPVLYNSMFVYGLNKMANQIYDTGRFFFTEADFEPEYDTSKSDKGYLSAGLSLYSPPQNEFYRKDKAGEYRYAVVQSYVEDDYLIIRIDDGQIYRYPLNALRLGEKEALLTGKHASAYQISNGRWIPVELVENMDGVYGHQAMLSLAYEFHNIRSRNNLMFYQEFMMEKGFFNGYPSAGTFFFKAKKNK
ncbi:hypothetical protein [Phocaeicola plebeius]|uniref:hypothetical protein n=1 Tax=Phocaeicola plebeius TaxID=310297 RepID=UPI0026ECE3A6|nr:hypothetical protein [Phocaeicola plebeius]